MWLEIIIAGGCNATGLPRSSCLHMPLAGSPGSRQRWLRGRSQPVLSLIAQFGPVVAALVVTWFSGAAVRGWARSIARWCGPTMVRRCGRATDRICRGGGCDLRTLLTVQDIALLVALAILIGATRGRLGYDAAPQSDLEDIEFRAETDEK